MAHLASIILTMAPSEEARVDVTAAVLVRCSDGVIEIRVRDGARIDVPEMKEIFDAQLELAEGKPSALLIDIRPIASMTRASQQFTARSSRTRDIIASAIVIESPVSRLLGNFYLQLSRPRHLTTLFNDEVVARAWLHERRAEASS